MVEEKADLLTDIEIRLVQASAGKRFVNFLIDLIYINIVAFVVFMVIGLLDQDMLIWLQSKEILGWLTNLLINIVLFASSMALIEIATKGRSLGKLLTGTKAVMKDGSPVTMSAAIARSFARLVPLEPFSAFGSPSYPWHDEWSKTYVIDLKESILKPEVAPVALG